MAYSETLNKGLIIADIKAQPLATQAKASKVLFIVTPEKT